jgi:hypothetical protein
MTKISNASKPDTTSKFFSGGSMRDMNLSPYLKSKRRGCWIKNMRANIPASLCEMYSLSNPMKIFSRNLARVLRMKLKQ